MIHGPGEIGIPVREAPPGLLRYDEMICPAGGPLLVGEVAHFKYRMRMLALNRKCRADATEAINAAARRILGE